MSEMSNIAAEQRKYALARTETEFGFRYSKADVQIHCDSITDGDGALDVKS